MHKPVGFQLLQMLDQHLVAHVADRALLLGHEVGCQGKADGLHDMHARTDQKKRQRRGGKVERVAATGAELLGLAREIALVALRASAAVASALTRTTSATGELTRDEASMQTIRAWVNAHGPEGAALMDENASYVFFEEQQAEGAIGSQGVVLLINSPGGSPVQAGIINDEIHRLKALHN